MIELSRMTNRATTIARMSRLFLSVKNLVLNYAGAFELQYGVLFIEDRIKDIVEDMTPS